MQALSFHLCLTSSSTFIPQTYGTSGRKKNQGRYHLLFLPIPFSTPRNDSVFAGGFLFPKVQLKQYNLESIKAVPILFILTLLHWPDVKLSSTFSDKSGF